MKSDDSAYTIFNDALEIDDPAARASYVKEACANDAALSARVQKLLRADGEAGQFLSPASTEVVTTPASSMTEKTGDVIGRYKLLEQIGEGGCGVVYMAEQQEPVRRRVALKVIKLGMDTKQVVARFEAERQALAMMDHPNIARVLDAGATSGGRPYFVMELVRGMKITEFCDRKKLSTHERLELFIRVCQAVQHAHQKGIIHRDLKPSNILVTTIDGAPVPKVIDFGIAKATSNQPLTDKTLFTAFEQFIGTPAYMSPEQAEISGVDVDTRTDLYSLGVVLYELLTGKTPFDAEALMRSGIDGIRRTIREQEPPKPSTRLHTLTRDDLTTTAEVRQTDTHKLVHSVSGDLDWIVMKCLEKDRARRYETVNGLAADVQRHLDNEAVMARPPSASYRVQKLIRRNRIAFAAVGAVAAALLIGMAASLWQAIRAKSAEQQAKAETERATKAEGRARQALAKSQLDLAEKEFERGKFVESQRILEETPESFRDANWRFLRAHSRDFSTQLSFPGKGGVHRLQFLPQGDRFAARCYSSVIGIFTLAGRQVSDWVPVGGDSFSTFGIDGAGGRIAFTASANEVALRELATGNIVRRWTCEIGQIKHVLLSPDGGTVLATSGNLLIAYATQTGAPLWTQPSTDVVPAFSPDGRTVAVLSEKNGLELKIRLLDALTGTVRNSLAATADNPEKATLQFNQNGARLACLGGDEAILWDSRTGVKIRALHFPGETARLLSPRGDSVATRSGRRIRLWDTTTGRLLRSFNGASTSVTDLAFSPDGKLLLSSCDSGYDGIVYVWPIRLEEETASVRPSNSRGARVLFDREGSRFYATAARNSGAWVTRSGRQEWTFGSDRAFLDMAVHPTDGSVILSEAAKPAFTHVSSAGKALEAFGTNSWSSLKFSRDGQLLLAVDKAFDATDPGPTFRVMEYPSGQVRRKIPLQNPRQPFAAFCLDDAAVVTAAIAGGMTVWDWKAGTPLRRIDAAQTGSIGCLAASPDGLHLATGGPDRWIRVWEAATGRLESAFRAHWEGVRSVEFSPNGREILSGSEDGTVRLHALANGEERLAFYGLTAPVVDVDFSPDGTLVAAISTEGFAKVWDRRRSSEATLPPKPASANRPGLVKDADGWQDLLAQLTPDEVEKSGKGWTLNSGELFSPDAKFATLPLPGDISFTDYRVRVKLRRLSHKNVFHVVLPVAERMCGFELEGRSSSNICTGLILVNGLYGKDLPGVVEGKQVHDSMPHDLEVTVRLNGANASISATLDSRPLYEWTGVIAALSQHNLWATTKPGFLALGTYAGDWAVSEVKLKRLETK